MNFYWFVSRDDDLRHRGNTLCIPYIPSLAHPVFKHWTDIGPGMGVTKPISSVPLFSPFSIIVKTDISSWIWRWYFAGVAAAQLRWHLRNMNVIQGIQQMESFACGEINERSFSNPHPWSHHVHIRMTCIDLKFVSAFYEICSNNIMRIGNENEQ